METRKRRIRSWKLAIILAFFLYFIGGINTDVLFKEKTPITVYAPEDMESAFKDALVLAGLKSDYRIVMTTDPNSNICVDYAKQDDNTYTKFAFSPFVIAYSDNDDCYKALIESKVLVPSEFDDKFYEIDFLKVVDEVIKNGNWSNLGIEDLNDINIFYPSEETPYWHDFYDFMLVTVNNGSYPDSVEELEKAEEYIQKFFNSPYTEEVTDFNEKMYRVGGFPDNSFYILPEKVVDTLIRSNNDSIYTRLLYPTETIYFNYYVKGDEIGKQLISAIEEESGIYDVPYSLACNLYRNSKDSTIEDNFSKYIYGESDMYNVIKISEKQFTENSGT